MMTHQEFSRLGGLARAKEKCMICGRFRSKRDRLRGDGICSKCDPWDRNADIKTAVTRALYKQDKNHEREMGIVVSIYRWGMVISIAVGMLLGMWLGFLVGRS